MNCPNCGAEINDNAVVCQFCGKEVTKTVDAQLPNVSEKPWVTTFLLCWFLGLIGAHRFYTGKKGTGILMLLTGGCCGILYIIDFWMLILGKYTDSEGKLVVKRENVDLADASEKPWLITFLLCWFLGIFGVHRFYTGKKGTGILMLLTGGCCGVLTAIDFWMLIFGKYTDSEGKLVIKR